jgi:hypothetical protein
MSFPSGHSSISFAGSDDIFNLALHIFVYNPIVSDWRSNLLNLLVHIIELNILFICPLKQVI